MIEDGQRIHTAEKAAGLDGGKNFTLYSPEKPTKELNDQFLIQKLDYSPDNSSGNLMDWGLLNTDDDNGLGFFSSY